MYVSVSVHSGEITKAKTNNSEKPKTSLLRKKERKKERKKDNAQCSLSSHCMACLSLAGKQNLVVVMFNKIRNADTMV